jgi:hypothetical protein
MRASRRRLSGVVFCFGGRIADGLGQVVGHSTAYGSANLALTMHDRLVAASSHLGRTQSLVKNV